MNKKVFEEKLKVLANYLGQEIHKIEDDLGTPSESLTNDAGTKFLYYKDDLALFTISADNGKAIFLQAPVANVGGFPIEGSVKNFMYEGITPDISEKKLEKRWGTPDNKYVMVWTYSKHGGKTLDGSGFDFAVNFMGCFECRLR